MKQVHIQIDSTIGRGKTTTALDMLSSAMKQKNTSTYFVADEMENAVVIDRLAKSGAFNEAYNLPIILANGGYSNLVNSLDEVALYLSNEHEDTHSYIVIDAVTLPPELKVEYINKFTELLKDRSYTIVTTVNVYRENPVDVATIVATANPVKFAYGNV